MEFVLRIELGNAAMESPEHVAAALVDVAHDLRRQGFVGEGEVARISDVNGNRVGTWELEK